MKYASELENVEFISTGLFTDKITNGVPRGKIMEVWGDASVGKSTLCLQIIASAQKQGLTCLWADVEYSYETSYAKELGTDNSTLGIIRERDAETILDSIESAIADDKLDLVIIDSIGGLTPRAEIEKGADGKVIGGQAGLVARFCRKVVPLLAIRNIALIVINHSFVDIMSSKVMTSGGRKLDYHKSLSIRLKAKSGVVIKQGEKTIGKVITAIVTKDKVRGQEKSEVDGQLLFGQGFSITADLLDEALRKGIIERRGNTFFMGNEKLGMISKVRERLKDESFATKLQELLKK